MKAYLNRIFDFLQPYLIRTEWRLVYTKKTGELSYGDDDHPDEQTKGCLYIHLYESNTGERKFSIKSGFRNTSDKQDAEMQVKAFKYVKTSEYYNLTLYRWLCGRADPEIPRYSEVPQEETMHYLRGTVYSKKS